MQCCLRSLQFASTHPHMSTSSSVNWKHCPMTSAHMNRRRDRVIMNGLVVNKLMNVLWSRDIYSLVSVSHNTHRAKKERKKTLLALSFVTTRHWIHCKASESKPICLPFEKKKTSWKAMTVDCFDRIKFHCVNCLYVCVVEWQTVKAETPTNLCELIWNESTRTTHGLVRRLPSMTANEAIRAFCHSVKSWSLISFFFLFSFFFFFFCRYKSLIIISRTTTQRVLSHEIRWEKVSHPHNTATQHTHTYVK